MFDTAYKADVDAIAQKVRKRKDKYKRELKGTQIKENFGQDKVRALRDYAHKLYITGDVSLSYRQKQRVETIIENFNDWCMNYTGN